MPHTKRERERETHTHTHTHTLMQPQTRVEFTDNSLIWLEYSEKSRKKKKKNTTQKYIFDFFRFFERN